MKDKIVMMYDHIRTSADVDLWAIKELQKLMWAYLANACEDCAFYDTEEWEMPCRNCKRNCKDYWRKKEN